MRFKNIEKEEIELRVLKYQYIDIYDNEKGQSLNKYKGKGDRYVSLPFNTPHLLLCKESNRLIDLSKRTKCLNHFVYISNIG